MSDGSSEKEVLLPPCPLAPLPSDCCGTGCCPCVHDIYQQDLEDWKKLCKFVNEGDAQQHGEAISSLSYKLFEIVDIKCVGNKTFLYTFKIENTDSLNLKVGQHLILKQIKENGSPITRQYTPISDLNEKGKFEILIKIYDKGRMTKLIKDWKIGDKVPWRGPFGSFKYTYNSYKRILLLGAGTGITPLYQLIQYIIKNEQEETVMNLGYSSKTFEDILLRSELLELTSNWNFSMIHFLSCQKYNNTKKYREEVILRRIQKCDIQSYLKEGSLSEILVLICGTKSYVKDMMNYTKDLNVPDQNIFKF